MRLGRYEVLKHLASGGMADVLLGRSDGIEGFARHVVLKRIKPVHAQDQRFIRMFLDEARLAANLHHQHIVQVHDIGEAAGEYFIAMEYLHGEDVRTILAAASRARQQVPLGYAIAIVSAAAAGLHYAHERRGPDKRSLGIVHRDVSPSNILVGYDGSIKVVDFGIAKASARQETRSGSLKGKVSYMSPEQCKSAEVDRRSDVYSLGVVLYELATTTRLFKGESDYLVMDQIVNGRVPLPRARRADLPDELSAIIMRAIAPDPERRFASADELRVALDQFANRIGLTASTSSVAAYMRTQFGDKPEPWQELSGLLAVAPSGSRPAEGGWTELWRSDTPLPGTPLPGNGSIARPSGAQGSGGIPRMGRALGTDAGSDADDGMDESSVRRAARPAAPQPSARAARDAHAPAVAPAVAPPAVRDARAPSYPPAPVAGRLTAAKIGLVAVPLLAVLGGWIWWFTGPGLESPAVIAPTAPPAASRPPARGPATPAPIAAVRSAATARGTAQAADAPGPAAAHPHPRTSETLVDPPKRSGAPHKSSAAKVVAADEPGPAAAAAAAPPPPPNAPPPNAPGSTIAITSLSHPSSSPATLPTPATAPAGAAVTAAGSAPIPAAVAPPLPAPAVEAAPSQLSHVAIDRVASSHTRELSRCDGGEALRGEITVRFAVDAAGRVTKPQVATTLNRPKVAACVLRLVQKWQFPPQPAGGALGTYTLSFQ